MYFLHLSPLRGQPKVMCHPRWTPTEGLTEFAVIWGFHGFEPATIALQSSMLPLWHFGSCTESIKSLRVSQSDSSRQSVKTTGRVRQGAVDQNYSRGSPVLAADMIGIPFINLSIPLQLTRQAPPPTAWRSVHWWIAGRFQSRVKVSTVFSSCFNMYFYAKEYVEIIRQSTLATGHSTGHSLSGKNTTPKIGTSTVASTLLSVTGD
jgi:hypothetical protein